MWWAHLDSNQGPTDYESARDVRNLLSFTGTLLFLVSTESAEMRGFRAQCHFLDSGRIAERSLSAMVPKPDEFSLSWDFA